VATGTSRVTAVGRLVHEAPYRFRIERHGVMRVPGVVYASPELPACGMNRPECSPRAPPLDSHTRRCDAPGHDIPKAS